jgi:hypothetical protein
MPCDITRAIFIGCSGRPAPSEKNREVKFVKFRRVSDSEGNQGLAIRDLGSGRIEPFAVQRDITGTGALQFPVRRQRRRAVILARRRCWFAPVDVSWSQHRRELASCRETDRRGPLATRPTPPISVQLDGRAFQGSRREGPADSPRRGPLLAKNRVRAKNFACQRRCGEAACPPERSWLPSSSR